MIPSCPLHYFGPPNTFMHTALCLLCEEFKKCSITWEPGPGSARQAVPALAACKPPTGELAHCTIAQRSPLRIDSLLTATRSRLLVAAGSTMLDAVSARPVRAFVPSASPCMYGISHRPAPPAAAWQATSPAPLAGRRGSVAAAAAAPSAAAPAPILPEVPAGTKNVVVLGGTGRVGASTAAALAAALPDVRLSLAGRSEQSFREAVARRPELSAALPLRCDIDDAASLSTALKGADLVIHAAGPFQRRSDCSVLEAAIAAGVPYVDVCDDTEYSQRAKALHDKAQAAGVPAITTAGIYPGGCRPRGACCQLAAAALHPRLVVTQQAASRSCLDAGIARPGAGDMPSMLRDAPTAGLGMRLRAAKSHPCSSPASPPHPPFPFLVPRLLQASAT